MNGRFCAVISVHSAFRRAAGDDAARHLAQSAGITFTSLELIDRDQARLAPSPGPRDVVDVASAIRSRAGALLVIDALGGGPDADRLYDDDAEHLLANVCLPTLVFGPHATLDVTHPALFIAADASGTTSATLSAATAWTATFESTAIVVALDAPDPWPSDGAEPSVDGPRRVAAALAGSGMTVDLRRNATLDPVATLIDAAATAPGAVLVIPGARFPTSQHHWFSTSRRLIRHAPRPVLLVPA
jgi:hypothetical protein